MVSWFRFPPHHQPQTVALKACIEMYVWGQMNDLPGMSRCIHQGRRASSLLG